MIKIFAPASIGNIGVGFDVLGAAISPVDGALLGDCITVTASKNFCLKNSGSFVSMLPIKQEENIVYQCWQLFCYKIGQYLPVEILLEKNMPIASGLGSSSCSVVASLVALNIFTKYPFNSHQLLAMMGQIEGYVSGDRHYDNVAPCYLGGVQLVVPCSENSTQQIPSCQQWFWVIAYPGTKLSTVDSRAVLPAHYSRQDCIDHAQNLAAFIHASHTKQWHLAAKMIKDVIAEPYRTTLLPGFLQAKKDVIKLGALSCSIAGSGPTLFSICETYDIAQKNAHWLSSNYLQNSQGFVYICKVDNKGARQIG